LKIHFDRTGAVPAAPDFGLLRAGLQAAQQATPTAKAQAVPAPAPMPAASDALVELFNGRGIGLAVSFNASVARHGGDET
jgi:hypothetical protein